MGWVRLSMRPEFGVASTGGAAMSAPSGPPNAEGCSTVIPRLKLGQMSSGSAPVKITRDTIGKFCNTTLGNAALALGISPTALKKACRKLGVTRWPLMPPNGGSASALQDPDAAEHSAGEGAFQRLALRGMCIITNDAAVAIFKARDESRKKQDRLATRLSFEYGISTKAVRDIWNLRTWSHVTKPFWTPKDFSRRMLHSKLCTGCKKDPTIASIEDACEACNASAMAVDDATQGAAAQGAAGPPSTHDDAGSAKIETGTNEGEGYVDVCYISKGTVSCETLCSVCGCDPEEQEEAAKKEKEALNSNDPLPSKANDPTTRRPKDAAAEAARTAPAGKAPAVELAAWGFRPPGDFGGYWIVEESLNFNSTASASSAACDMDETGGLGPFECNPDADGAVREGADIKAHFVGNSPGEEARPRRNMAPPPPPSLRVQAAQITPDMAKVLARYGVPAAVHADLVTELAPFAGFCRPVAEARASAAPVLLSTATDSSDAVRTSCPQEHIRWLNPASVAYGGREKEAMEEEGTSCPGHMRWLSPPPPEGSDPPAEAGTSCPGHIRWINPQEGRSSDGWHLIESEDSAQEWAIDSCLSEFCESTDSIESEHGSWVHALTHALLLESPATKNAPAA